MQRFENVAMVRVAVVDTNLAERLRKDAVAEQEECSDDELQIQLGEYIALASSWVRCPMQLEVSTDGGETWMPLPSKGGMKYSCSTKGELPSVDITVPVMEGIYGGSVTMTRFPPMPGAST